MLSHSRVFMIKRSSMFGSSAVRTRMMKAFSTESTSSNDSTPSEINLYKGHQKLTIRTMLGISMVNMFYWSSIISNHCFVAGKVVEGIDLAGTDPPWGYFVVAATGLIIYFTRHFAHNVVYQSYLTPDQKRIGFQVHNLFGNPGRKFEVQVGKAKFLSDVQMREFQSNTSPAQPLQRSLFNSSLIALRVDGIEGNVLIDREVLIRGTEPAEKLIEVLCKGANAVVDSKEERLQYMKHGNNKHNAKKKK